MDELLDFLRWLQSEGVILAQHHRHDDHCRELQWEHEEGCGKNQNDLEYIGRSSEDLIEAYMSREL